MGNELNERKLKLINKLEELEIIKYIPKNDNFEILYLQNRIDSKFLSISEKKLNNLIHTYEDKKLEIIQAILSIMKDKHGIIVNR